jgi:two-component system NtrC family response regulator
LISATNKDLNETVKDNTFRNDLFYRIKTFHIEVPPLRKRTVDIQQLTQYYLYHICNSLKIPVKGFTPEFLEILQAYNWPGNVRELISILEKTVLSDMNNPTLYPMHLPKEIRIRHAQAGLTSTRRPQHSDGIRQNAPTALPELHETPDSHTTLKDFRERIIQNAEIRYLTYLMETTQKKAKKACEISGLSLSRLYTLLRNYNIPIK